MSTKNAVKKYMQGKEMEEALKTALSEVGTPENMTRYGQQASDMIKLRTRLGSGVAKEGDEKSGLKPLADSTVDQRKRMKDRGELSSMTSPGKSNLTRTGQMLDSIKPTSAKKDHVTVGPTGERKDGKLTNDEVGFYVTVGGRPFNNLSKTEIKRLTDALKRDLQAAVRRQLQKLK